MRLISVLACALTVSLPVSLPGTALHAQESDPPSRVARISALAGQASLQPAVATAWSEAALNYSVTTGDRLFTSQGARLELEVGPMSVRLSESSDVTMTNLSDDFMQLGIAQGTMRVSVYRLQQGDSIEVDTPNGAVMITSPGDYRIDVPENDHFTVVSVDAGRVEIMGPGIDQELRSGQAVQLTGTDNIRAVSMPRPQPTEFDQWGADRDRVISGSSCSQYMNQDIPGCADLDDSGRWERNAEYGDVWYPTHVSAGWIPYRDGRWVWIEPWGWSWVADEPWGYAPFHYGRWAQFGNTWGWIPGPVTVRAYYAPALVAFVGGAGWSIGVTVGSQAWFPLGPREAYIPSYHHGDSYLRQVNVTNLRNVTDINTIINVRNVDHVNYVNRARGITAVPTDVFRNGRPTSREGLHVNAEENMRGSILSHPPVAPVERAALGGRPVAKPPVAERPVMITRGAQHAVPERGAPQRGEPPRADSTRGGPPRGEPQRGFPPARGDSTRGARPRGIPPGGVPPVGAPPVGTPPRGMPPRGMPPRGSVPPVTPPVTPPVVVKTPPPSIATPPIPPTVKGNGRGSDRSKERKVIITRTPPPPTKPPFKAQEPTLKAQPGKPLEPQQVKKVKEGNPPGPPRDPENPPAKVAPIPTPVPPAGTPPGANGRGNGRGDGRGAPPVNPPTAKPPDVKPPVAKPPVGKPPEVKPPDRKPPATDRGRGGKPDSTGRGGGRKPPDTSIVRPTAFA